MKVAADMNARLIICEGWWTMRVTGADASGKSFIPNALFRNTVVFAEVRASLEVVRIVAAASNSLRFLKLVTGMADC